MTDITQLEDHCEADDLVISNPVTFMPGAQITSLTGGTAVARAKSDANVTYVGTATIQPGGVEIIATWAENTLPPGRYTVQVRVTVGVFSKTTLRARLNVFEAV